jgi:hypothetical protein
VIFYYNYSNNFNFNNKSDKIKFLRIDSAPLSMTLCKDATVSDVFPFFLLFSYFFLKNYNTSGSDVFPTSARPKFKKVTLSLKKIKDTIASGIFAQTRQSH